MKLNRNLLVLILSIGSTLGFAQDKQISPTLLSLFDAERAFAKRCGEVGIRASFLEFFTDDAIVFRPHPAKYKEAVKDRPAPPNPLAYALEWEPIFGEVSAAGDMGYDTGPSIFTDKTAEKPTPQYGFFFSVWKKQADGNWKVVLDVGGAETKELYKGSREMKTAPVMAENAMNAKEVNVEAERANLLNAERAFLKSAQTDGMAKAFAKHLSRDARLHRNGVHPVLGHDAIAQFLAKASFIPTWEPMFADVAQSGDLGYTYGSYELKETSNAGAIAEKGYYARVWKRGPNGQWQVVLDTTSPLPPEGR
ncbi:nuclear transport factor 2 family protein [candidate division KSB1 bacterium]|nr:nuclear transport factor 2 family protein [candidate division KSB1 bacterium]